MKNKPVFWTLLVVGAFLLGIVSLLNIQANKSIFQLLLSLGLGVGAGIGVSIYEYWIYKKKQTNHYHPTQMPYIVQIIIIILNILFKEYRAMIAIIFGSYLIILAIAFKIYEIRSGQIGVKWNELFQL